MRVLVCAASKHGATTEIAGAIGAALADAGLEVVLAEPDEVAEPGPFNAFVLGSAVYAGHWMKPAKEMVARLGPYLDQEPVWLFSSGPVGDPLKPEEDPVDMAELVEAVKARGHHLFSGVITKSKLSFGEKAIVAALKVPEGDYRDWGDVRSWAQEIAQDLRALSAVGG